MTLPSALRFYHFGQKYSITKCFLKSFPQTCDIVKTERANLLLQLTEMTIPSPPPDYYRPLNPISSRAADYASHSVTYLPPPPQFSNHYPALTIQFDVHVVSCYRTSIETWHVTQLIPKWLGRFLLRGLFKNYVDKVR